MWQLLCVALAHSALADHAPIRATVDLGKDPLHRWDHIVKEHKVEILGALNTLLADPAVAPERPILKRILANRWEARRIMPGQLLEEIEGIARGLGVDVGDFMILQAFYDLKAAKHVGGYHRMCAGVVAQSASGEIVHGRNLDYTFTEVLRKLTLVVDFVRNGSVAFTAVTLGPSPVFNTAVRYHGFSVSQNERDRGSRFLNLWDTLVLGRPALFAHVRHAVEHLSSFEEAVRYFGAIRLNAAAYFILGGTQAGEGAVVTRERDALTDVWRLDATSGRWYVLETNYDHWDPTGSGDDRRAPLVRQLNATGPRNIAPATMWDVLSVSSDQVNATAGERGPLNQRTIYTAVMQAARPGSLEALVRSFPEDRESAVVV